MADNNHQKEKSKVHTHNQNSNNKAGSNSGDQLTYKLYSKVVSSETNAELNQQTPVSEVSIKNPKNISKDFLAEICIGMINFMKEIITLVSNIPGAESLVEKAAATHLGKFTGVGKNPVKEKITTDPNNNKKASSTLCTSLSENDIGVISSDIEENSVTQTVRKRGKKKGKRKNSKEDSESEWTELGRTKKKRVANGKQQ